MPISSCRHKLLRKQAPPAETDLATTPPNAGLKSEEELQSHQQLTNPTPRRCCLPVPSLIALKTSGPRLAVSDGPPLHLLALEQGPCVDQIDHLAIGQPGLHQGQLGADEHPCVVLGARALHAALQLRDGRGQAAQSQQGAAILVQGEGVAVASVRTLIALKTNGSR